MKTINISTPDGKTISLTAPDDATDDEIRAKASEAVGHYKATMAQAQTADHPVVAAVKQALASQAGPVGLGTGLADADPTARRTLLTTVGAEAGLPAGPAAAGAGAALGGTVADVADNPQRALQAGKQIVRTAADAAVAPQDVVSDASKIASPDELKAFATHRAAEAATAATTGYVAGKVRGIVPQGPMGAGAANPELAIPGKADQLLQDLGSAKVAARQGEDLAEASRLRRLLQLPAGRTKLAEEAIDKISNNTPMSPTQLLAYREALGKVSTKGGTFANDFAQAKNLLTDKLEEAVPGITDKLAKARAALLAKGQGDTPMSLIGAVMASPVAKAFKFPGASTLIGAAGRGAAETSVPAGQAALSSGEAMMKALDNIINRRKKASS